MRDMAERITIVSAERVQGEFTGLLLTDSPREGLDLLVRTGVAEVCDANPYLLRAAKFHGKSSSVICPICRKEQLTLVSWVFGDHLGPVSGSARTAEELVMLATRFDEFSVHVVEVCRTCSWNHLVKSYKLGEVPSPKGTPRRTQTARGRARTASE